MVTANILIRAREPCDAQAVAAIMNCPGVVAGTLRLPYSSIAEQAERMGQRRDNHYGLVAEIDGRVVGSLGLTLETSIRRRHCAGLGMAVHDDVQGQGVGSALLAAAIDLAENWLGLRRLELHVYTDNAAGIRLYQKFGFVIEGTAREFALRDGTYIDAYAMARVQPVRARETSKE